MRSTRAQQPSSPVVPIGRQKHVDLASSGGAGLIGLGLGALLAGTLQPAAVALLVIGAALHGWSMNVRHRGERRAGLALPTWAQWLYWSCWIGLGVIAHRLLLAWLR